MAAELTQAVARVSTKRARLLELYLDGRVDRATFDSRERPLVREESQLREQLAVVQAQLTAGQSAADRHAALVRYCALIARGLDRLDDQGRRALVRQIVTRVIMHDGRVEILGTSASGARCRRSRPRGAVEN